MVLDEQTLPIKHPKLELELHSEDFNNDELNVIASIWTQKTSVVLNNKNGRVTDHELRRLMPNRWWCDEIVNYYLEPGHLGRLP